MIPMLKFVYSEKAKNLFLKSSDFIWHYLNSNWIGFFQTFVSFVLYTNFNGLNVLLLTLEFSAYFSSPNILPNRKRKQLKGVNFPGSQNPQFCRLVIHRSRHLLKPVRFKINELLITCFHKKRIPNSEFSRIVDLSMNHCFWTVLFK